MQQFLAKVDKTNQKLSLSQEILSQITQNTRKVSGSSSDKESKALSALLTEERDEFLSLVEEVNKRIAALKKTVPDAALASEKEVRKSQVDALIKRTQRIIDTFSSSQIELHHQEKERLKSQYIIAKPNATEEEIDDIEYSTNSPNFVSSDKKNSLKDIAKGVQQVTKMTNELNLLVHSSDKSLDKISESATKSEVKAKKADKDLKKAKMYQKLARIGRLFFYGTIVFIISGFIIALLVWLGLLIVSRIIRLRSDGDSGGESPSSGAAPATSSNAPTASSNGANNDTATNNNASPAPNSASSLLDTIIADALEPASSPPSNPPAQS